jgi:hypothetical protein
MSRQSDLHHRVLVVEDEALIALDLERRLTQSGFEVVGVADNCEDALDLFSRTHPDLVLMDIFIQGARNGIDTARAIADISDVPVVFLTAYADDATVLKAAEISPYGYLIKPFDELTLSATITVALERYAADTRLRLLGAAVDSATVGIALVDVRGEVRQVVFANASYLVKRGLDRGAVLGKAPRFPGGAGSPEVTERIEAAIQARQRAEGVLELIGADGVRRWCSITLSPVANRTGQITHVLVFEMDITRQRQAEAALAESQRLEVVGRLTAGIAHDFNNLLGAIVGFAELAREGLDDADRAADIGEILHAARRGVLLTRKLLDFSRRGDSEPMGSADLCKVVSECRPMIERLIGPAVRLHMEVCPGPTFVGTDATAIEQIVLNLVANARDVMPDGGRLALKVSQSEGGGEPNVRLEVTDSGPGIDESTLRNLFTPFFTTKARGAGTGLGLATSKMLVERAGGAITVTSVVGQGATFSVQLPQVPGPEASAAPPPVVSRDAKGALALVVEDEGPLRRTVARALSEVGFSVIEAPSGEDALRVLEAQGPSLGLLVCDMVLPGVGGAEVLREARRVAPQARTLIVTGYYSDSSELLSLGTPILWKPFTPLILAQRALDAYFQRAMGPTLPTPVVESPAASPRRGNILLVEDDDSVRAALRSMLEGRQFRVVAAATAAAALAQVGVAELDAAVVDVHLPDMDGVELLARIRDRDPSLPTLVITGAPSVETVQRALRGRAFSYLTKPVAPGVFLDEVGRAVDEGHLVRLRHKLLMSRAGADAEILGMAHAEAHFEASLQSLVMHFQPIVRAATGEIFAYEALLRPRSEVFRTPPALLTAAEVLGRVDDLGRMIRGRVVEALRARPDIREVIFVNLHPAELRVDLLTDPNEPLLAYARQVVLEVTERAQLDNAGDVAQTVAGLHAAGYRVAIDDLGEGYAGLSWLVKVSPDVAKLDMSLVRDIHRSRSRQELVASLVGYCRRVHIQVVAEGVEVAEEAVILRQLGCELLQGYYFARPGPDFPLVEAQT